MELAADASSEVKIDEDATHLHPGASFLDSTRF